jgi:FMN phosphatase YigB (HAD superfamily)
MSIININSACPTPQAIYFDAGETLIRPRRSYGELLGEICQEIGIALPVEAFGGLGARIETRVTTRTQQQPFTFPEAESQRFWFETYHGFFVLFLSDNDACVLAHAFLGLLSSPPGYALFEDVLETLVQLSDDGYRLGIISNWEAWLPALLEAVGLAPFFDHVIISGVCGAEKPDARIFTLALEEGGYRPEEVIYIGDRPSHDVEPAREVGIRPILLDREGLYSHDLAHQHIASLSELPVALHMAAPDHAHS